MNPTTSSDPKGDGASLEQVQAQKHWVECHENPDHLVNFIPIKDFAISHLPEEYQNNDIVLAIKTLADLTVLVRVQSVSKSRKPDDRLYLSRGQTVSRTGSGVVVKAEQNKGSESLFSNSDCKESQGEQKALAKVVVRTACHVVFDDEEAKTTTFDLFYDDEENTSGVKRLHGNRVLHKNEEMDQCFVECVTDDLELADFLDKKSQEFARFSKKIGEETKKNKTLLSVIASHPHGKAKMITVMGISENEVSASYPKVNKDEVVYTIPTTEIPTIVSNNQSDIAGVEVQVYLPNGTKSVTIISPYNSRNVKEAKEFILCQEGYSESVNNWQMMMHLPEDVDQEMDDGQDIDYYHDDLCSAHYIFFKDSRKPGSAQPN